MTTWKRPRLSWSRLGIGISIGLVLFGAIDATLPHSSRPDLRGGVADDPRFRGHNGLRAGDVGAGQRSPTGGRGVRRRPPTPPIRHHPEGDTVERAALAPGLAVPRRVAWPEAWVAEDRRTTVVLDPPGPVVAVGSGQVAVVVTGRTVVTTDAGQTSEVPLDERITLRLIGPTGTANASHWVVTDVGTGS